MIHTGLTFDCYCKANSLKFRDREKESIDLHKSGKEARRSNAKLNPSSSSFLLTFVQAYYCFSWMSEEIIAELHVKLGFIWSKKIHKRPFKFKQCSWESSFGATIWFSVTSEDNRHFHTDSLSTGQLGWKKVIMLQ